MNNKQFKVAVTRQLPEPVETRMKELFDVNLSNSPYPLTKEQLLEIVKDCDVLPGGIYTPAPSMGETLISRLVQRAGLTFDLI